MEENAREGEYVYNDYFETPKKSNFSQKAEIFLESKYFVAFLVILVATTSFFLGMIFGASEKREAVKVYEEAVQNHASVDSALDPQSSETVVASKNGVKYHYSWCPGAKQISEANKITFNSIEEARAAGYSPASNCKGLK